MFRPSRTALLALPLAAAACCSAPSPAHAVDATITLTEKDFGRSVVARPGAAIVVRLSDHGPGGHHWNYLLADAGPTPAFRWQPGTNTSATKTGRAGTDTFRFVVGTSCAPQGHLCFVAPGAGKNWLHHADFWYVCLTAPPIAGRRQPTTPSPVADSHAICATIALDDSDEGRTVHVGSGDTLEIQLPNGSDGGFTRYPLWDPADPVLKYLSAGIPIGPPAPKIPMPGWRPGGGMILYRFAVEGAARGRTEHLRFLAMRFGADSLDDVSGDQFTLECPAGGPKTAHAQPSPRRAVCPTKPHPPAWRQEVVGRWVPTRGDDVFLTLENNGRYQVGRYVDNGRRRSVTGTGTYRVGADGSVTLSHGGAVAYEDTYERRGNALYLEEGPPGMVRWHKEPGPHHAPTPINPLMP